MGFVVGWLVTFSFMVTSGPLPVLLLPVCGVLVALALSVDLGGNDPDAPGVMIVTIMPLLFLPYHHFVGGQRPNPLNMHWLMQLACSAGLIVFMFAVLGLGSLLVRAAMNRGFLFYPFGIACYTGLALAEVEPWPLYFLGGRLVSVSPPHFLLGLVLVVVILIAVHSSQICLRGFRHNMNSEMCCSIALTALKRRLALLYLIAAGACLVSSLFLPMKSTPLPLAAIFLATAIVTIEVPHYVILTLLQYRALRRLRIASGETAADPQHNVLFLMPAVPLSPPGVRRFLVVLQDRFGDRAVASFAAELFLKTGYQGAASWFLTGLAAKDPWLSNEMVARINELIPRPSKKPTPASPDPVPPTPAVLPETISKAGEPLFSHLVQTPRSRESAPPLVTTGTESAGSARDAADAPLYTHLYQAPRGQEGSPLMALPIWSPVATYPEENLTLPQIVYRTLASVREPFRRTILVVHDPQVAEATYTALLQQLIRQARLHIGAGPLPVALSVRRLLQDRAGLDVLADTIIKVTTEVSLDGTVPLPTLLTHACRRLVEVGLPVEPPVGDEQADELTEALEAGNAWILLMDDMDGKEDLTLLRRLMDLVFGQAGLSHVALLEITPHEGHNALSDMQSYRLLGAEESGPRATGSTALPSLLPFYREEALLADHGPGSATSPLPSGAMAKLLRVAAGVGTPPMKRSLTAITALGSVVLMFVVLKYDAITQTTIVSVLVALGLMSMLSMFLGYRWGLGYGSEEVRRAAVDSIGITVPLCLTGPLLLLPRGMGPGVLKGVCVALAGMAPSWLLAAFAMTLIVLLADIAWLILSSRQIRTLDHDGWVELCRHFRVQLHVARHGLRLILPGTGALDVLPLLLSFRTSWVMPMLLELSPELETDVRRLIIEGLRKKEGSRDYSTSSLLLSALLRSWSPACRRCLRGVADDCASNWGQREAFATYEEPSTTFEMNALEYAARQLCFLTNIEELVAVR